MRTVLFVAVACYLLSVKPAAAIDTTWNFNGDLMADTGTATMSFRGDMGTDNVDFFSSEHDLGLPMPFGDNTGVMRFQPTTPSQGLEINLNNGGATVADYTMVWDLFRPGPSWHISSLEPGKWLPLFQTNLSNSNDADFFINQTGGIGIDGQYDGQVTNSRGNISWDRVAVTRAADGTMKKYIDGAKVGQQSAAGTRWDIDGAFNILADNDDESSTGFLSSFRFVDSVLDDTEIGALGAVHAGGANVPGQQLIADPAVSTPGSFTVAIVGDTQNYSSGAPGIFNTVTQWLVDNQDTRNIRFVIQDGDIVNNDQTNQWDNARAAMENLDGEIPYAVVRGNHDIGSQYDWINRFGSGSPYSQQSTLVDHYDVPGHPDWDMRNTVHKFEANDQKIMVLTIDISAGDDVVTWANGVISANPDYRVILDTHAYLYDGGERFNNAPDPENPGNTFDQSRDDLLRVGVGGDSYYNGAAYDGQDAETLWNNLVSKHQNISMLISGHQFEDFDEFKYHLENGDQGNKVYELLVDPQNMANGGDGWIRLLEFGDDGTTVRVKTYSPYLGQWDTAADNYYEIGLSELTGEVFVFGDLNDDDMVDGLDWLQFVQGMAIDMTGLSKEEAYALGDLNEDFTNNYLDFQIFKGIFDVYNGAGSFDAMLQGVPEPATLTLGALAFVGLLGGRMRRHLFLHNTRYKRTNHT